MPVSSQEISDLINGQMQQMAAQRQVARQLSMVTGMPALQPVGTQQDDYLASTAEQGSRAAEMTAKLPGAVAAVGGMAAMMGYAPRILDPFTTSFAIGSAAKKAGGMAGAIGAGAGIMGAYTLAGMGADYLKDQVIEGAQNRAAVVGMISQAMPHASTGFMHGMARGMENMSRSGAASIPELTNLMGQGLATGDLRTRSLSEFQSKFSTLIAETKQVAATLNSSLNDAYAAIKQVESVGVSRGNIGNTIGQMRYFGQAGNLSQAETTQIVAGGVQMARMANIDQNKAITGSLYNAAAYNYVGEHNLIKNVDSSSAGQHSNAGYRFFGSQYGQRALAAMMDDNGNLDQGRAAQMAAGTLSRTEIQRLANKTFANNRETFDTRSQELAASYLNDFGPAAIAPAVMNTTQGSYRADSLRQSLTGLHRGELESMSRMNAGGSSLRAAMMDKANEGFDESQKNITLGDALGMGVKAALEPLKHKVQNYGAELTKYYQEAIQGITEKFVRKIPERPDPAMFQKYMQASATGDMATVNSMDAAVKRYPSSGEYTIPGVNRLGTSSFLERHVPMGLRSPYYGTAPGNLPGNGFLPEYSADLGDVAGAWAMIGAGKQSAALGGLFGAGATESVAGLPGAGLRKFGGSMLASATAMVGAAETAAATELAATNLARVAAKQAALAAPSWFQKNIIQGMAGQGIRVSGRRALGVAAGAAGFGATIGARALPVIGEGLLAYDFATTVLPGISQNLGYSQFRGGIVGSDAEAMEAMADLGLGTMRNVTPLGMNASVSNFVGQGDKNPLIPVGDGDGEASTFGDVSQWGGIGNFLTGGNAWQRKAVRSDDIRGFIDSARAIESTGFIQAHGDKMAGMSQEHRTAIDAAATRGDQAAFTKAAKAAGLEGADIYKLMVDRGLTPKLSYAEETFDKKAWADTVRKFAARSGESGLGHRNRAWGTGRGTFNAYGDLVYSSATRELHAGLLHKLPEGVATKLSEMHYAGSTPEAMEKYAHDNLDKAMSGDFGGDAGKTQQWVTGLFNHKYDIAGDGKLIEGWMALSMPELHTVGADLQVGIAAHDKERVKEGVVGKQALKYAAAKLGIPVDRLQAYYDEMDKVGGNKQEATAKFMDSLGNVSAEARASVGNMLMGSTSASARAVGAGLGNSAQAHASVERAFRGGKLNIDRSLRNMLNSSMAVDKHSRAAFDGKRGPGSFFTDTFRSGVTSAIEENLASTGTSRDWLMQDAGRHKVMDLSEQYLAAIQTPGDKKAKEAALNKFQTDMTSVQTHSAGGKTAGESKIKIDEFMNSIGAVTTKFNELKDSMSVKTK